jgi:hypothetical protein
VTIHSPVIRGMDLFVGVWVAAGPEGCCPESAPMPETVTLGHHWLKRRMRSPRDRAECDDFKTYGHVTAVVDLKESGPSVTAKIICARCLLADPLVDDGYCLTRDALNHIDPLVRCYQRSRGAVIIIFIASDAYDSQQAVTLQ